VGVVEDGGQRLASVVEREGLFDESAAKEALCISCRSGAIVGQVSQGARRKNPCEITQFH